MKILIPVLAVLALAGSLSVQAHQGHDRLPMFINDDPTEDLYPGSCEVSYLRLKTKKKDDYNDRYAIFSEVERCEYKTPKSVLVTYASGIVIEQGLQGYVTSIRTNPLIPE